MLITLSLRARVHVLGLGRAVGGRYGVRLSVGGGADAGALGVQLAWACVIGGVVVGVRVVV